MFEVYSVPKIFNSNLIAEASVLFDPLSKAWNGPGAYGVFLPEELNKAVDKRKNEFLAGRVSAAAALKKKESLSYNVPIGAGGAPSWPEGFTGSITHSEGFASAAVGRCADIFSIGIDNEVLLGDESLRAVLRTVFTAPELEMYSGYSRNSGILFATLVFSAKESLYKALYPKVGRIFDYTEAKIDFVDMEHGVFQISILNDLPPGFLAGTGFKGVFSSQDKYLRTGLILPAATGAELT